MLYRYTPSGRNIFSDNTASRFVSLRQLILVTGVAVITMVVLMSGQTTLSTQLQAMPAFVEQEKVAIETTDPVKSTSPVLAKTKQQRSVANWLAKRYRVANDAAHFFVSAAFTTAKELKLDPLLILSVMAIESGLNPMAESPVGAQGLMQVMSKIHKDKFKKLGGLEAALDPVANIQVGSQILKQYIKRGGSVEAGLKMYVGAAAANDDGGYGSKVLEEYNRLKDVSSGKSVPTVTKAKPAPIKADVIEASLEADDVVIPASEQVSENHAEPELVTAI